MVHSGEHIFFYFHFFPTSAAGELNLREELFFFSQIVVMYPRMWGFLIIFSEPVTILVKSDHNAGGRPPPNSLGIYRGTKLFRSYLCPHSGQRKKIVVPSSTLLNWASDQVISVAAHFGQSFLIRAFSVSPSVTSWTFDVSFVRRTEGNPSTIVVVDCENMVSARKREKDRRERVIPN